MKHSCTITSALIGILVSGAVHGQTKVPDRQDCGSCSIEMWTTVVLGSKQGAGAVATQPAAVQLDGRGNYWVIQSNEMPMVFDQSGMHLATIGRKGSGPAEFQNPYRAYALPGDSMLILDPQLERAYVVSPSLELARSISTPGGPAALVVMEWPRVLVNRSGSAFQRDIAPLQFASFASHTLEYATVLETPQPRGRVGDIMAFMYALAPSSSGGMWSTPLAAYSLTEWDAAGSMLRTIERESRWFPPGGQHGSGTPSTPPSPTVRSIAQDSSGYLWVFYHLAADDWARAWEGVPSNTREIRAGAIKTHLLYDTVVEVLDPDRGVVIVRRRITSPIIGVLPGLHVAVYREDDEGIPSVAIMQLRLRDHAQ